MNPRFLKKYERQTTFYRHVHLIKIKYCEDTRPEQQLEAAQRQHADLCKLINAKVVTLHNILLGIGGTCYTEHTLNHSVVEGIQGSSEPMCPLFLN
eukprot:1159483-Pelagomonas_calceolata.AAC.23